MPAPPPSSFTTKFLRRYQQGIGATVGTSAPPCYPPNTNASLSIPLIFTRGKKKKSKGKKKKGKGKGKGKGGTDSADVSRPASSSSPSTLGSSSPRDNDYHNINEKEEEVVDDDEEDDSGEGGGEGGPSWNDLSSPQWLRERMIRHLHALEDELRSVRAGDGASPSMLDGIKVEAYGNVSVVFFNYFYFHYFLLSVTLTSTHYKHRNGVST